MTRIDPAVSANDAWVWLDQRMIEAAHDEQLAEHGGPGGLRDAGMLSSALARPQNRARYESSSDAADLAASYAFGIARNHPFVDGNKRTAFVALETFLELNRCELHATDEECVHVMLGLAAGEVSEEALGQWIRERIQVRAG
jgi:death-on-curing protein